MTDTTRDDIAARHRIPAHILRGDTPTELETHAQQLAALGYTTTRPLTADETVDRALGNTTEHDDLINTALGNPVDIDDIINNLDK